MKKPIQLILPLMFLAAFLSAAPADESSPAYQLVAAAKKGDAQEVQRLLGQKTPVDAADQDGDTALMAAAAAGNLEVMDILIKAKAKVDAMDKFGDTALLLAISNNQKEAVSRLIAAKADVNDYQSRQWKVGALGETPLALAASYGYYDIAEILINAKANPNEKIMLVTYVPPLVAAIKAGDAKMCKLLLDNKANPNEKLDADGTTPLFVAVTEGNAEIIKTLIDAKANVNADTETGYTPLMFAAMNNQTGAAKLLLEAKAKADAETTTSKKGAGKAAFGTAVNVIGGGGLSSLAGAGLDAIGKAATADTKYTALMFAAMEGNDELVSLLLDNKANVNKAANLNTTALWHAAEGGHASTVSLLLKAGAKVKITDQTDGDSELQMAILSGSLETVSLLLENGSDANGTNKYGQTPLMYAARKSPAILKAVLDKAGGAAVNKASKIEKWTALMGAAWSGSADNARTLLDAGADINAKTKDNETPLFLALCTGHNTIFGVALAGEQTDPALLEVLLNAAPDVNAADKNGHTPLMLAAAANDTNAAKRLLAAKANPALKSRNNETALMFAVLHGNADMAASLIEAGASAVDKDKTDSSVLMYAAAGGSADIVKTLLAAGADAKAKNKNGKTALMFAAQAGSAESFKLLLDAGADIKAVSKDGTNMLAFAAMGGEESLVDECIGAGIPVNSTKAVPPLAAASGRFDADMLSGAKEPASLLDIADMAFSPSLPVVQKLLAAGAKANAGNPTALHNAVVFGDIGIVKALLEAGADPLTQIKINKEKVSPILLAAKLMPGPGEPPDDNRRAVLELLNEYVAKGKKKLPLMESMFVPAALANASAAPVPPHPHTGARTGVLKDTM